jgi:hypothetical protein
MTGKPFPYSLEGEKATLRGTPPRGQESNPLTKLRYEITLRK